MHSAYFEIRFRPDCAISEWPSSFAIVTAHATTGQHWTDSQNHAADKQLRRELEALDIWLRRLIGYSPSTGHAEPGWAAELSFDVACDIGLRFQQDAVYFVEADQLFVSHCDDCRRLIHVGEFRSRVDLI